MKNASVVIALIVGLGLGLVVGRMTVTPGEGAAEAAVVKPRAERPTAAVAADDKDPVYKVPVGNGQVKGPADAPVTIVEFSDYQCPFCGRVEATISQIEKTYGDQIRLVFKNNPLPFHQHAQLAAEAAEAAGAQGKFWQMHAKLFQNQKALTRADLEKYAEELGLDMAKFKSDLDKGTYKAKIAGQQAEARRIGATGTPAFFINGKNIKGAQPFANFKKVIDAELANAKALQQKGVAPAKLYETIIAKGRTTPAAAKRPQQAQRPAKPTFQKVEVGDGHVKGPADAKVTIIEWSDYQCPFCGRVEGTLHQIEKDYGNQVRLVFKNQPLPFHQNAMPAAEAAEAAGAQGKFWEMHDKLFQNQRALTRADLEKYAQELGLNMAKFKADLDNHTFQKKIKDQSAEGMRVGARGTPAFFLNGRFISGAQPYPNFKKVIDEEIAKADKLLKTGTPRGQLYAKLLEMNEKAYKSAAPAARPAPAAPAAKVEVSVGDAPVRGATNAPITIVEFSDFQCPFCGRAEPTMKQILDTYQGKVKIAFKHQPLPFHQHAELAAEAAMAAQAQGKFWEMHDKMFANQRALTRADLDKYAQEIGLDMGKFKAALDNGTYKAKVQADSTYGRRLGANGTPTFFINGRKVVGAQPFDAFKQVIDDELKAKKN